MKLFQLKSNNIILLAIIVITLSGCNEPKISTLWLVGDSTMTDYANYGEDYMKERYPQTGWGQALPPYLGPDSLKKVSIIKADSLVLMNKARGGRSSRSFFEEGRWADIYSQIKPGDWVIIQFGHNDASESKGERYVSIPGYKEFIRLYVNQTREKGANPILITSVCRNYPWIDGKLGSSHGDYPQAMKEVAAELSVYCIDLTQISAEYFTEQGKDFVTENYFMNIPAGKYEAYPDGLTDNTHFQPAGAKAVAQLVFNALVNLQ